ncbi:MAG: glutathione S-transferase family protein [Acetobacteraceae bacterium]|nr:glutathione S-transferase family protein [Acetobacteraceae bacterium]MSP31034.1 glutathione S-transferase family protein [Acetobacteraceae bacterium]
MTLTLIGSPYSRTVRTLWMVKELGIPYENIDVKPGPEGSRTPEHLKINPNGHVPVIDDDGLILWESLAINLYLARKHGGPLAPANISEEGQILQWTLWAVWELEPHAQAVMSHGKTLAEDQRDVAILARSQASVEGALAVLNGALTKSGGHLVGNRFTVSDLNVASCLYFLRFAPEMMDKHPAVRAFYDASKARPHAKAAFALRGD